MTRRSSRSSGKTCAIAAANLPERVDLVVGGAAVALLVVFLGALRATLREKEGEAGALSATAVIAGSVVAAGALVDVGLEETSLRSLLAFPTAALLAAASIGILRTEALDRRLGYAGLAAAALQLPAGFTVDDRGVAVGAFAVWAALTSFAIVRSRAG
jgi:hypothetical protein